MNQLKRKRADEPETAPDRRATLRSIEGNGHAPSVPAVQVSGLRKTYPGGVEAVKGIDFEVAPGEVFGLLGPNGAGKSTTIGMLTTTVVPTSGSARLAGYDVASQPLLARGVSSVVFQDSVLDGPLSGRVNLELHARLWGVPASHAERRIGELVQAVGLAELIDRPVATYSGGQKRRLEIARALVSTPRVLFLDEPTVGLDPRIRHEPVGLVIPLSCIFAGLSVLVDRHSGAQRELLAAPVPRAYLVLGNLIVAIGLASLQVAVLIGLSAIRGGSFHITGAGVAWFVASALLFTVFMYCVAETLASRVTKQEDYVGATPAVAILPFFFAGALFPITAMPAVLTAIAKAFPLTHALALMRYGFIDPGGKGLHDIWGMHSVTAEAWLSLAVVALWAVAFVGISIRVFSRSAVS